MQFPQPLAGAVKGKSSPLCCSLLLPPLHPLLLRQCKRLSGCAVNLVAEMIWVKNNLVKS